MLSANLNCELDGLLVVNKPKGWTSHDVVAKVKGMLQAKKVGHTGTLDPAATGVMILCINKATKWASQCTDFDKYYRAAIYLGTKTDTGDAEGRVIETSSCPEIDGPRIIDALKPFIGVIRQRVPKYSAVRIEGRPLYKWARQNKEVVIPYRDVEIRHIAFESWKRPQLTITVECSKGTYIRTLAEDIGEALKVPAHLAGLTRLAVGRFTLEGSVTLESLEDELKRDPGSIRNHLQTVEA
jgi:tRNA pseudouridine55 synthase